MNRMTQMLVIGGALLGALCCDVNAQYSIDWYTIDGGGGTSTGGVYSVSGTIGQPDAGTMSGGNYTLTGGFWGVVAAIQTPGAPYLTVFRTNNNIQVSWPAPGDGFLLRSTTDLSVTPLVWNEIPPPYQTNGGTISYTQPAPTGNKFFQLHKP